MTEIPVREVKKGMLIRGGEPARVYFMLGDWRKAKRGSTAYNNGWQKSVIDTLVLDNGVPVRAPYTTELWIQPGTEEKTVEVLWNNGE